VQQDSYPVICDCSESVTTRYAAERSVSYGWFTLVFCAGNTTTWGKSEGRVTKWGPATCSSSAVGLPRGDLIAAVTEVVAPTAVV
jgi:hypothetical protein